MDFPQIAKVIFCSIRRLWKVNEEGLDNWSAST